MKNTNSLITKFCTLSVATLFVAGCAPMSALKLPDDTIQETGVELDSGSSFVLPSTPSAPPASTGSSPAEVPAASKPAVKKSVAATPSLRRFSHVDPKGIVPKKLRTEAFSYYLRNESSIKNKQYLSVIDYSRPSNRKRLFIMNLKTGNVWALPVAHGRGSDPNHDGVADRFSNRPDSHATSLGVYKTAETYKGAHGYSLRLDGLSSSNSNARPRAIVVHGADYVQERDVIQGRSHGCPAVPMKARTRVIDILKGGSLLYAGRSI
ncbi:MAG: murein L,D-transpeptidase catalytic domain family protein [Bdellovibrionota bacterium]